MAFINTIPEDEAPGDVQQMYEADRSPEGYIPNYVRLFSHRPEVMNAWGNLLGVIKSTMDARRYELVTLAAARTQVRCWGRNPGLRRPARICSTRTGWPVIAASDRLVRSTWPPPSPYEPSIVSM